MVVIPQAELTLNANDFQTRLPRAAVFAVMHVNYRPLLYPVQSVDLSVDQEAANNSTQHSHGVTEMGVGIKVDRTEAGRIPHCRKVYIIVIDFTCVVGVLQVNS